ncbi:MAG: hypothetical protein N2167_05895 [Flavobacteriales bacterium]|nr:hypothetical protein [Flavobacteriales bacterium]
MKKFNIKNLFKQHAWWLILVVFFIMHLPFLQADPLVALSHSRDAFTDEGLNTSQVRNWANYGAWNVWECDNLIKNPLFNAMLALPFKVFGTNWLTARLTVLLSIFILFLFAASLTPMQSYFQVFIFVTLLQFHAFHYAHFSMAEMVAVACVVASIASWIKYAVKPYFISKGHWLYVSLIFVTAAWWLKIQFAYLVFLIPISTFWLWLFAYHHELRGKKLILSSIYLLAAVGFSILLYVVIWYVPNKEAWIYIMNDQAMGRFPHWKYLGVIGKYNFLKYFYQPAVLPLFIAFVISIPISIWLYVKQKSSTLLSVLIISSTWVILELHKIFIHHVPGRYLVSLFVAIGLFTVIVWLEFAQWLLTKYMINAYQKKYYRNYQWGFIAIMLYIIALFVNNVFHYVKSLNQRSYAIYEVSKYIQKSIPDKAVALGAWSPSLTWGTMIRAVPVWKDFLNDKHILETFRPQIIFSEPEEQDSNGAFSADGIQLREISDSIKCYTIGKWPVNLYWINPEKMNQAIQQFHSTHEKL